MNDLPDSCSVLTYGSGGRECDGTGVDVVVWPSILLEKSAVTEGVVFRGERGRMHDCSTVSGAGCTLGIRGTYVRACLDSLSRSAESLTAVALLGNCLFRIAECSIKILRICDT